MWRSGDDRLGRLNFEIIGIGQHRTDKESVFQSLNEPEPDIQICS